MAESNHLGLSNDDFDNMKRVLDDLIEAVVTFNNSFENVSQNDWAEMLAVLDYAKFVVSGIVYANGFEISCDHDHEYGEGEVEYDLDDEDGVE